MKRPRLSTDPDAALLTGSSPTAEWDGERFVKRRRASPEDTIQKAIVARLRWLGCFVCSVPNEGARTPQAWTKLRARGARAGAPDLLVIKHGRVALLETKAPRGRLSDAQIECHAELLRHGYSVAVVTSQDEAVDALRERGFAL